MATNKSADKKAIDVARPGKPAPDTSARPVLVTHRPMVQDPMVKTEDKDTTTNSEAKLSEDSKHESKTIQPVSQPEESTGSTEPEPESAAQETTPEEKEEAGEAAIVDAVVDQATADKKKSNELSDAEKAQQEHMQKLITDKKYFVPIGQVSRRRNRRASIVLLVLLLIVAGGYLAVDAGIIKTSIKLPVDFIKN